MKMSTLLLATALIGIIPLVSVTAQSRDADNRKSVSYADLGTVVKIIGPLEEPLGKVLTIEGKLVPKSGLIDYWSANIAENLFAVQKIDGKPLPHALRVQVHLPQGHAPLVADKSETFIGYQDGGFVNVPAEAEAMRPPGYLPIPTNGWHFDVRFICIDSQAAK